MARTAFVLLFFLLLFLGSVLPAGAETASLRGRPEPGSSGRARISNLGVRSPLATIGSKILFAG